MSLFGFDDIPAAPVFERRTTKHGSFTWSNIDSDLYPVPDCHPHDAAWITSILHGIPTKGLGQQFEPPTFKLSNQQVNALISKYSIAYSEKLDESGCFQLARVAANTRLARAAENFSNR